MEEVDNSDRAWAEWAIGQVEADANRSADTHLHPFPLPPDWGISLYLKDESVHPTGSLKHRLARSPVLFGLCNNWIHAGTTLVEAPSGSTAVSEAYFARLINLPFVAVMPATTVEEKIELIEFYAANASWSKIPTRSTRLLLIMQRAAVAITSTSSRTPNGRPTGAATTTSPNRCLTS